MGELDLSRVTVATTVDHRPPYCDEAPLLFASLERFGGAMRRCRRRAYCIEGVPGSVERRLGELGVEVRVCTPVNERFRFANKLRMFDPRENGDTDLVVALDSDVIVAGDFAEYLDATVVQAKQVDGDALTLPHWDRLFATFGVSLPQVRFAPSAGPGWTHAYFNTGVVLAPGDVLEALHARWLYFVEAIIDRGDELTDVIEQMQDKVPEYHEAATGEELRALSFAEQWAFSLALHDIGTPYAALPLAMNFPIPDADQERGRYLRDRFVPDAVVPLLLHHHHRLGEDGLPPTGYREPDRAIARVSDLIDVRGDRA